MESSVFLIILISLIKKIKIEGIYFFGGKTGHNEYDN